MARIRTALHVLALAAGSLAVACGDGEKQLSPAVAPSGTGGTGVADTGTRVGGSSSTGPTNTGGAGTTGGTTGAGTTGGTTGAGTTGGTTGAGTTSAVGGDTSLGGSSTGTQTLAGGTSAIDTFSLGGDTSVGGVTSIGGETSVGGASSFGGDTSVGGVTSIGGETGVGGTSASTGGALPTGGAATGGTSALSCVASYVAPTENQSLADADDLKADCSDGIQYNVVVATNAPNGTPATLTLVPGSGDATVIAESTVSGATVRFNNVTLPASGAVTLTASIAGGACTASESLTLNCAGAPSCTITSPTITATHPALNNVAVAEGGDRVSSVGSPYQVAFAVETNIGDGRPVSLTIDGGTTLQTTAIGGVAKFGGVYLIPDGVHTAKATCTAKSGISSTTLDSSYGVDTVAPELTPKKGTGEGGSTISALNNGDHYDVGDDADAAADGLQIKVCGSTSSADAKDIPATNPYHTNFCASVGGNSPICAPVTSAGDGVACVNIDCPGKTPFGVALTLKDAAGNPTTTARTSITCASSNPSVAFVSPVSDSDPFSDPTKRILAATNASATRKDKNASAPGAQYDVTACTDSALGTTAILYTGYMGQSLTQTASTTVVANADGICPTGNLIKFSNATLPDSLVDDSYELLNATELQVSVTDLDLGVGSAKADVWVDAVSPSLSMPLGFCGKYFNTLGTGSTTAVTNMTFQSTIPVTVTAGEKSFTGASKFGQATVANVELPAGSNTVSARATKPSTNYGIAGPCDVTVGDTPPPAVVWQSPISGDILGEPGNVNAGAVVDVSADVGWQGTLKVCTDIDININPASTVQFTATVDGNTVAIDSVTIEADATCPAGYTSSASLSGVTVPDGQGVLLRATTSQISGNTGTASATVTVSSTLPGKPAIDRVDITNRRQTSFTPVWSAPSSGGAAGYRVRVSNTAIAASNDFLAARDVAYAGSGACPVDGCSVLVKDCYIENDYYFAVAAVDFAGNLGAFSAIGPKKAQFNQSTLTSTFTKQRFGRVVDGSGDLNGDGFADVVVAHGNGKDVFVYFGSASGFSGAPIDIQGAAQYFGYSVAVIGDVNHDGRSDLAIGSPFDGDGAVYVYYGRAKWTVPIQPDVKLDLDASATGDSKFAYASLGWSVSRIGDFNGDAVDDFAVGAPFYNGTDGAVAVVLGKAGGLPSALTLPSAFGTDAIRINGPSGTMFGWSTVGLGHFYNSTNTALVVVAGSAGASGSSGALYSFQGTDAVTPAIDVSTRRDYFEGPVGSYLGSIGAFALGNVGVNAQRGLGVPLPNYTATGEALLFAGSAASGPFAQSFALTSSVAGASGTFGKLVVGGGVSGSDTYVSLIGSSQADVVLGSIAGGVARIYLVDGSKLNFPGNGTVPTAAQVTVSPSSPLTDFASFSSTISDIDGDSYPDLVVGVTDYSGNPGDGSVLVLN